MSKFDAAQGFWQVPMAAESKPLMAFTLPQGHFQFLRRPFGLVNSTATFNHCMQKMLTGLDNVDSFVDDLLIHNPESAERARCENHSVVLSSSMSDIETWEGTYRLL